MKTTTPTKALFQGLWWDERTGLYDVRARYLEPVHGRFIMLDTVGIWTDSLARGNGYAFAGTQPFTSGNPDALASMKKSDDGYWLDDDQKKENLREATRLAPRLAVWNACSWGGIAAACRNDDEGDCKE